MKRAARPALVRVATRCLLASAACLLGVWLAAWAAATVWPIQAGPAESSEVPNVIPPGQVVTDFVLRDPEGNAWRLSDHLRAGPVVIEFGNNT